MGQNFNLYISALPTKGEYHDNFCSARFAVGSTLDRAHQACLFDRMNWLELLHRLALPDRSPLLLHATGRKVEAWMPFMQQSNGHHVALANCYNFTWRAIFGGAYDDSTRMSLLRQCALTAKDVSRRLMLAPVPDEDGSASQIAAAFASAGWVVDMSECDQNHYVRLEGRSFDAYWAARPSQLRNTVKRKGKAGVVSTRIERAFSEDSWRDYESVYGRSWKPLEGSPKFLEAVARQEGAAGNLRLGLAYIDDQPVAAQFWTVENGIALIHKLAHDERHVAASPGTLLSAAVFQHVIDVDKVEEIDFGTGSDAYKIAWMEAVRPRYRIDILRPNHPANWPILTRQYLRQLRRKVAE